MTTADAIRATLQSPNVSDSNGEIANVVDTVADLARGVWSMSRAITPNAAPGVGANGYGHFESLTEAVMDVSESLSRIAEAIGDVAEALREEREIVRSASPVSTPTDTP